MRAWRTWAAIAAMASGLACGADKVASPADSATGTWSGTTGDQTMTLVISDQSGELHGSGTIATAGGAVAAFTVLSGDWSERTGRHVMTLSLSSSTSAAPVTYSCTTKSANECDGAASFVNGNVVYFTIAR